MASTQKYEEDTDKNPYSDYLFDGIALCAFVPTKNGSDFDPSDQNSV